MGRRKMIVMDDPVLTDEQKEQCRKNALIWEMVHRDLFAHIGIPFFECEPGLFTHHRCIRFCRRCVFS